MTGKFADRLIGIISEGTKDKTYVIYISLLMYRYSFVCCICKDFRPYLKIVGFVVEMFGSHDGTVPGVTLKPGDII